MPEAGEGMQAQGHVGASQGDAMQRWLSEKPREEHWNVISAAAKRKQY